MSEPDLAAYEQLAEQLEADLELAGEGRFDELLERTDEREALMASLPDVAPPEARAALERAWRLHQRVTIELLRGREALTLEVAQLERAQRTARGYTPPRGGGRRIQASA